MEPESGLILGVAAVILIQAIAMKLIHICGTIRISSYSLPQEIVDLEQTP